jgi:signal transduction histidine kinase
MVVRPQREPVPNAWQWRIILWFLGWLAVCSLAGYLFARRMTAPLGAFARAAERLGHDPRAPPMTLSGPAELGAAARAFNEMQVRIRRYVDDRTAMVGAISHDLRTPLTRIRFKVEGASPSLRDSVVADVAQMEAMISAVLAFIRDANAPTKRERLDLLSLLECQVDDAALVGADVTLLDSQPVIVVADALGLQRLFGNLIDNAVKYGGGARVGLSVEAGEAVVAVSDDGPGLPAGELERVFDAFYRAEPSRNRDSGGVGLGLSVARSIARAHGGDLVLEPKVKGLAAIVRLPLPPAA